MFLAGLVVLKEGSGVLRAVVNTCRSVVLWIVQLIAQELPFRLFTLLAMATIAAGVAMYNYSQIVRANSWRGDEVLRREVACRKALKTCFDY